MLFFVFLAVAMLGAGLGVLSTFDHDRVLAVIAVLLLVAGFVGMVIS